MLTDYLTLEEIQADQRRIAAEYLEARQNLDSISAPGACG